MGNGRASKVADFVSDPAEVANLLSAHWGNVLSSSDIDGPKLQTRLDDVGDRLPESENDCWNLDIYSVEEAISAAQESLPGPDGMPCLAYKKFGAQSSSCWEWRRK